MLLISFIGMCIYGTTVEGKTLGENRDEILWGTDPIPRSIFPLRGYVENSIVTLCFYDNPSSATITIADAAATPIYKTVYSSNGSHATNPSGSKGVRWEITQKVEKLEDQPWKLYAGAWGEVGVIPAATGPLGPWYKRMDI